MKFETVDFTHPNAGQTFVDALQHTGFALIENHPVSQTLLHTLYELWLQFFSNDEKHDYVIQDLLNQRIEEVSYLLPYQKRP